MNAVLQALLNTPLLRNYFLAGGHMQEACTFTGDHRCLSCEMVGGGGWMGGVGEMMHMGVGGCFVVGVYDMCMHIPPQIHTNTYTYACTHMYTHIQTHIYFRFGTTLTYHSPLYPPSPPLTGRPLLHSILG